MKILQKETTINPIFTKIKHVDRSEKYKLVDSLDIIEKMNNNNFQLVGVSYAKPRKKENYGYQKHIMIFEHNDLIIDDENKLQLLVTNSHNGKTSLQFNLGVFRMVCSNGIVVGDSFRQERILHVNCTQDKIDKTIIKIAAQAPAYIEFVKKMRQIAPSDSMRIELVNACIKNRFTDNNVISINNKDIVRPRRKGDLGTDLWTLFNRVQESMIRGGIRYIVEVEKEGIKKRVMRRSRAIKSIDQKKNLNQALWNTLEKIAA